jgi:hypothetical protein
MSNKTAKGGGNKLGSNGRIVGMHPGLAREVNKRAHGKKQSKEARSHSAKLGAYSGAGGGQATEHHPSAKLGAYSVAGGGQA